MSTAAQDVTYPCSRPDRTRQGLESALSLVANEVYRCALCAASQTVAKSEGDVVVADACLEAMLVHARAVLQFLLSERKQASDIHRTDFPGPDWTLPGSPQAESWRTDMKVINKHLAHLTWDRLSNAEEPWPEAGFAAAVVELATAWTDHLALSDEALAHVARPWLLYSRQALERSVSSRHGEEC